MKTKIKFMVCQMAIMGVLLMVANSCKKDNDNNPTITDIDGNVYHTVTIGTQVWMVENLKTTKYRNGDPILNAIDPAVWAGDTTGAYCNYNNNTNNVTTYGRLYNWFAVNESRNIAPNGWHIPTDGELTILITFLGGEDFAGGKLKETGSTHWLSPNAGATNETGLTSLPGGFRDASSYFSTMGFNGFWWTSTEEIYAVTPACWYLNVNSNKLFRMGYYKNSGFSVRCVKD